MNQETKYLVFSVLFFAMTGLLLLFGIGSSSVVSPVSVPKATSMGLSRAQLLQGRFPVAESKPYVLVEFGDYQCPPCQLSHLAIRDFVMAHSDKIQLVFRHLPLTTLHPNAYNAAVFAEATRDQGKFGEAHEFLFTRQGRLSETDLKSYLGALQVNTEKFEVSLRTTAKRRVEQDMKLAEGLGIDATPTLLLCTPYGQVRQIETGDLKNPLILTSLKF